MSLLILLSPAKKLANAPFPDTLEPTQPLCQRETQQLHQTLQTMTPSGLAQLMSISPALSQLNHERFKRFDPCRFDSSNAHPCLFAFQGDAYRSLDPSTLTEPAVRFLNTHLLILSGFYGVLRPMDWMQHYRLEMGCRLRTPAADNLYQFWQEALHLLLADLIVKQGYQTVVNLASHEYARVIDPARIPIPIITVSFKELTPKGFQTIGIHAKKARGLMTRFMATQQITQTEQLKGFNLAGYAFNPSLSSPDTLTFSRKAAAP